MPVTHRVGEISFSINANDHNPPHVHVRNKNGQYEARITLDGRVLSNTGFKNRNIKVFVEFVKANKDDFRSIWDEYQK